METLGWVTKKINSKVEMLQLWAKIEIWRISCLRFFKHNKFKWPKRDLYFEPLACNAIILLTEKQGLWITGHTSSTYHLFTLDSIQAITFRINLNILNSRNNEKLGNCSSIVKVETIFSLTVPVILATNVTVYITG